MRTLILLSICAIFVSVALLDARTRRKDPKEALSDAGIALGLGLVVCWFLVYVVGIFDNWESPWR